MWICRKKRQKYEALFLADHFIRKSDGLKNEIKNLKAAVIPTAFRFL